MLLCSEEFEPGCHWSRRGNWFTTSHPVQHFPRVSPHWGGAVFNHFMSVPWLLLHLRSWSIQCNDAAQLYAVLQIIKEYHMQAKTAGPAMQPHTAPSTGQGTGQGAGMWDTHPPLLPPPLTHSLPYPQDGCPIVHHVKNAQGESVFQEDCQMVLEEASLKLLRVSDGVPVWEVKLCHLQGVTMEGYTDGKGVLLVQTRQ